MHRPRTPGPGTISHVSVAGFLATPAAPGAHEIKVGAQWLDILYVDRGATHTLVCFHSALTDGQQTLPVFSGRRIAELADMNLISVADPSLALGDVDLAWFLGNRGMGKLPARLGPIIRHLLGERRAVIFGASGGGYAAVLYGAQFPGHAVLAVNPRLNLAARPRAQMATSLQVCHRATSRTPMLRIRGQFVTDDLATLYQEGLPFDLYLLQNQEDTLFRRYQAEPFVAALGNDPRLHYVTPSFGAGHVPIPRELLLDTLRDIRDRDRSHQA